MKNYTRVHFMIFGVFFSLLFPSANLLAFASNPTEQILKFQEFTFDEATIKSGEGRSGSNQFAYRTAFSSNSRFFALLASNQPNSYNIERKTKITVIDTQTGLITAQSKPFSGELGSRLRFSDDNTLLLVDLLAITPSVTWRFTETDEVDFACETYMGSSIEAVDASGQTYIVDTDDGHYQLCKPDQEKAVLQLRYDEPLLSWWGEFTKILHDNQLLVIYNIRPAGEPAHQGKVQPVSTSKHVIDPQWLDPWNLDYASKADHFFTRHDPDSQHLMLIESFPDQVAVNLWDYSKKQWLDKQFFQGLQATTAYTAGSYLLLQHESEFALLSHQGGKLQLLWRKRFPDLDVDEHEVSFSHDRQTIVFDLWEGFGLVKDKLVKIDINTGDHMLYPKMIKPEEGEGLVLSPALNYRVSHYFDALNLAECVEREQNSSVYSVDGKEKLQSLKGSVFAMSSDGQVLATCQGETLRLYRRQ